MARYTLDLRDIDRTHVGLAGGKGANLGELTRIAGIRVPEGFRVTTDAFRRILAESTSLDGRLDELSRVEPDDLDAIRALSAEIRRTIEGAAVHDDLAAEITHALARLGEDAAYAVRSSATAEDSPSASFAGQHDTFLNVVGPASVLEHVRRCWASLFSERAVAYRLRHGIDHRQARMAVVVQRMVAPRAAGVLFTADPVTGNRRIATVEATVGLGDALVSGLVNAEVYKVRGDVVARTSADDRVAPLPAPAGGARMRAVEPRIEPEPRVGPAAWERYPSPDRAASWTGPVLTDAQAVRLVALGRRIEAHFGRPQDIEWCLVGDDFHIVQSRPITTLFPIPDARDGENRVYVSVGHQQMMTDPIKPLGISFWKLTSRAPMVDAGGRLFVDVTEALASPSSRERVLAALGRSDPLIGDALRTILDRGDFVRSRPDERVDAAPPDAAPAPIETDPAIVAGLIERSRASLAVLQREIRTKSGPALLDFILADIQELRRILFDPESHRVIMAAVEATDWLNEKLLAWLGEKNAADVLTQSVSNNVTSEMGLALLDVADAIRPHPEVVAFLARLAEGGGGGAAAGKCGGAGNGVPDGKDGGAAAADDVAGDFLEELSRLPGGPEARDAIQRWLDRYGMRGVGEIDITRPRWSERPAALVPILLGHVRNFEPGEAARRFEQGRREAKKKEEEVLRRLRDLPDGERKAEETKRMIDRVRTFVGYREYPKYAMVSRYFVYKQALLEGAERLVRAGVLRDKEDVFYLTFEELRDVVRTHEVDEALIRRRKEEFRSYHALTPPRVLTSEGEAVAGAYGRDDLPPGALPGLAVSAGVVEGRARVVLDMADADLAPGDILVTPFTDPSWTPVFITIRGLVTEVGGLMTHGAVIAREYGLPAVVGVEHATRRIRDGQRIRVNGTEGWVEVLG